MLQLFHCVYCFSCTEWMFFLLSKNAQLFEWRKHNKHKWKIKSIFIASAHVHSSSRFCAFNNEIESIKMNRQFKRPLVMFSVSNVGFFHFVFTSIKLFVLSFLFISSWKKSENTKCNSSSVCTSYFTKAWRNEDDRNAHKNTEQYFIQFALSCFCICRSARSITMGELLLRVIYWFLRS